MRAIVASLAIGLAMAGPARAQDESPLVLTGTQATYSLTAALTAGTPIRVENVPPDGRQLALLKDYIARRMDALAPKFAAAAAAVTVTNALPADPLYRFAREANIRIVDIEAAVPWSLDAPGVAFLHGETQGANPAACAAALATLAVYEDEGLIENAQKMGALLGKRMADIAKRHPSVGAHRNIGLFGIVELVRDRATFEPMAPYNGTSDEMAALGKFFREKGLYTFVRWNTFFTNPPLVIDEAQLMEGLDIVDEGLAITDRGAKA